MAISKTVGRRKWALMAVGATLVVACHGAVSDNLLNAPDPDLIAPSDANSVDGANALRVGALGRLRTIAGGGEGAWLFGGLLADEWTTSSTFIQNDEADQRRIQLNNSTVTGAFRQANSARTAAQMAIIALNKYTPTATANIAEMYFVRGFGELTIAENFCNGTPLSDASTATLVPGLPLTNDQVFRRASASLDTAISLTAALTDAVGISINRAARIAKSRAQLGINDIAGAATTVAAIPDNYTYLATFALTSGDNILWSQPLSQRRYNVGDTLIRTAAGNFVNKPSLPFASAGDPRLPVSNTPANTRSQDGSTLSFTTPLWGQSTSIPVVSGIDARLVEAEAALKANDVTTFLAKLNGLRAVSQTLGTLTVPAMTPLTDPGTTAARQDLLFREKAFWTFSRGQRLSDLRRLIRQYGRTQDQLFPGGTHYRGVPYGTDVNLPVPQDEQNNPNFVVCADRNP